MRLVGGRSPGAQALEREHHLDRVEQADDARELGRREAAGQPHELGARHVDVDEQARERRRPRAPWPRERSSRSMPWAAMKRSSVSKRSRGLPSSSLTTPSVDRERRLRVARAVHGHEPERGLGPDQRLAPERRRRRARGSARCAARRSLRQPSAGRARPSRRRPRARTRRSAARRRRRGAARSPRARRPSRAAAAAPCRRRAPRRPAATPARRRARGSRPAARGRPRARRPPGAAASRGVARSSSGETRPERSAVQRDLRERRAGGRRDELRPPLAERIVEQRIRAHRRGDAGLRSAARTGNSAVGRQRALPRAAAIHAANDRHGLRGAHRPDHGRGERHRRGERAAHPGGRRSRRDPRPRPRARARPPRTELGEARSASPATSRARPSWTPPSRASRASSAASTCSSARRASRARRCARPTSTTPSGSA